MKAKPNRGKYTEVNMNKIPYLIPEKDLHAIEIQVLRDLKLDRLLSDKSIFVLTDPCEKEDILRRQELFRILEEPEKYERINAVLDTLKVYERTLAHKRSSSVPLEKFVLQHTTYSMYAQICRTLATLSDCGAMFADVAAYYSTEESNAVLTEIEEDMAKVGAYLDDITNGQLTFTDKCWVTPKNGVTDEYDKIADAIRAVGLTPSDKRKCGTPIDQTLSDAICMLHDDKCREVQSLLEKYDSLKAQELLPFMNGIDFFMEITALVRRAAEANIPHAYATVSDVPCCKIDSMYDVSLFAKEKNDIVPNDAEFTQEEPFCFLTGANGGGKTTYLRSLGINIVLFLGGCPIFANSASIYPFARVATHFPADERFDSVGRLDEEMKRVEEIVKPLGDKPSFVLFNETFSGADEAAGFALLQNTCRKIDEAHHFGLFVTHFHAVMNEKYPILSAQIDETDANRRTFKIRRTKGNASSYALDILKKYNLDKESLRRREVLA